MHDALVARIVRQLVERVIRGGVSGVKGVSCCCCIVSSDDDGAGEAVNTNVTTTYYKNVQSSVSVGYEKAAADRNFSCSVGGINGSFQFIRRTSVTKPPW